MKPFGQPRLGARCFFLFAHERDAWKFRPDTDRPEANGPALLVLDLERQFGLKYRAGIIFQTAHNDGLVARFKGVEIPATGFSIGVSRLYAALQAMGKAGGEVYFGPVVVLVMDKDRLEDFQNFTKQLRDAGIRAEMYLGGSGMRAQMKYADKRGAPCVIIQGEDERAQNKIMIKDLIEGARLSQTIEDNRSWRESRPAQFAVDKSELVEAVRSVLKRHES